MWFTGKTRKEVLKVNVAQSRPKGNHVELKTFDVFAIGSSATDSAADHKIESDSSNPRVI